MEVLNIAAYQSKKREQWKADILSHISQELDKVHPTNFEDVAYKLKDYAGFMAYNYAEANAAAEQRERLRREFPELCK